MFEHDEVGVDAVGIEMTFIPLINDILLPCLRLLVFHFVV